MKKSQLLKMGKRTISLMLVTTLVAGLVGFSAPAKKAEEIPVFKKQVGGVFDGMPLFDGVPKHLDAFVDAYFDYTSLEGPAVYATGSRNHYTLQQGANAGKVIPGALSAADNVQGISTDFPALVGMGQTWNKELLSDIGKVMGSEKISTLKVKQGESNIHGGANASATVAFTVVSDMRINPLSGRFDEGFSEDPNMAASMVDNMAAGLSGTDQEKSNDGFWTRAVVGTKHFSVYNAQWFRQTASNSASARSIFEYQTKSPLKALSSGSVGGVMTSFGRTNGIPNILSPYQRHANNYSKYGVYSSPDFNADQLVFTEGSQGNGYDTKYATDRTNATILMILAKANAGRPGPNVQNAKDDVAAIVNAVEQGKYGLTKADLIEAARPHINQMVRVGIFNEVDDNGIPKNYPFAQEAKDVRSQPATFSTPEHQQVALRAAEESIVLLKNDGVLPLAKNKKAAVSGVYADSRFKTTYSVGTTPSIENSGISPLSAIIKANGANNVSYDPAVKVVALKSKLNGRTVTADGNAQDVAKGSQLVTTSEALDVNNPAHLFEVYNWGQEGYSLRSLKNGRWVTSPTTANAAVENTNNTALNLTNNDWDLAQMVGQTSAIPPTIRVEENEDKSVSLISSGFRTGFSGDFTNWYYSNGRFITTGSDGKLKTSETTLGNKVNAANRNDEVKFEQTIVKGVGSEAVKRAETDDYAVVFVGAIPRHSAGEGTDRSDLNMGETDYQLVDRVSAAFAAKGKKTVVVVKSSFPVGMEKIQNNPNVSAIVYQPYGGQYDSLALTQVLYGDYAPTGRLSSTWYADMSAFPAINKYSIPEGNTTVPLDGVDPRYTVDMTNADPEESKLTYMYTNAKVTYPFGYGLSYSKFKYSDFAAPKSANGKAPFNVTVKVKNDGKVNTSEVVQLYVKNKKSAYGTHAPQKQLAAFDKVSLAAGETKTVTLSVNPEDFAIWDVNAGDFIVEEGNYELMVGASSLDIRGKEQIEITGESLAALPTNKPFNVFDHAFASDKVVYHEVSKARTAENLKAKKVVGGYYAVSSKQNGSWVALPKVVLTGSNELSATVASNGTGGKITLHADSVNSEPFAEINVPKTEKNTYTIENAGVTVNELGYSNVTVNLGKNAPKGQHTIYVVFEAPDLRIDSLAFEVK
ncbi:glycoside hydrolase family 3 C-terminal domain-containing protein [Bacillus sp. ISL-40]|uniref:glycoside hydrolase family 3 C-terminal domain-containing protein n=1 Tax=unclassified Bacillus (in: firmicutes) TaxID=185979 RepID=UPI001BE62C28|nr:MULTISPECIES: glycoside hydrolase family 3 C-terminal domain-containing protein [unclassified Bacillus (in: firmicutes)]MBT2700462.1 glycoside hydrolase family 3 C-terminal domain-containing protein [Bacillus sp. ISL-40]MBT2720489.1 glycoside hydrolase family 3 C-terminal domain-containing protein [Bacillus sp. ISL-46]MBT2744233.1 glycoside hydrolase family 3 C-terminal domain-containing protein [Bacillus sp. ISL-77]